LRKEPDHGRRGKERVPRVNIVEVHYRCVYETSTMNPPKTVKKVEGGYLRKRNID
jgi:hypothetical protein